MIRAATDLLVESGPRGVTVDAVAECSGVAKSTLYRHWSSRDEMLIDVVRCNVPDLEQPDLTLGFTAALRAHVASLVETLIDPEWSRIIPAMMALRTTMPDLAAVVESDRDVKAGALAAILDLGVAEGFDVGDVDAHDAMMLLVGPLVFASILGEQDRLPALADQVVDRFIDSARAGTRTAP